MSATPNEEPGAMPEANASPATALAAPCADAPAPSATTPATNTADTLTSLARALDAAPLDMDLHRAILAAMREAGDESGFLAHRIAVVTAETIAAGAPDLAAIPLYNLATTFYLRGEPARAKHWYAHALAVNPNLAIAHQNLAAIYDEEGRAADAQRHRSRAYSLQRVFVEPVERPQRQLLILCSGHASGNVPFDTLLDPQAASRIKYAIDYADDAEDTQLPPFDLVFNAIGEADIATPLTPRIERFAARCGKPLLNRPGAVANTQRHRMPALFEALDDVVTAACIRLDSVPPSPNVLERCLAVGALAFPLLMRPLATHGGDGLTLHASMETLWPALEALAAPCYLTAFHDVRSADDYFRKYRMVFVDGEPFPYHLAIAPHWMVHYYTAEMDAAWKIAEERRFLEDPAATLGERAMRAIAAIAQRLDLDYGGIDFTLLPDGRVFVFEANATMLVHREPMDGPLAHKNAFVQRIVDAFERMQMARLSGDAPRSPRPA
ncbi:hypothetical protein [Paraburkholderia kururiensis]|uniref:hypothetical protein n=1 Tax=Paraburkholderia kururiensis TaxID=984307 RepID=UPI0039A67593